MRFSRKHRLNAQADFRRVFAGGLLSGDRFFRVFGHENTLGFNRLGMAVSRRNCRSAVGRNRLKRLIRENFRLFAANSAAAGMDLVVLPTGRAATMCNESLSESLREHWRCISAPVKRPGKINRTNQ